LSVTTADLLTEIRDITDRENDPTLTDAEILRYASDGLRSLWDIFLESRPQWTQSQHEFTLTGNTAAGANVALPDDFELDLGLDWTDPPSGNGPVTVRRLPTFLDRNSFGYGANPLTHAGAFYERNYEVEGDNLRIYPYQNSSGTYKLWYQKRIPELKETVTVNVTLPNDVSRPTAGPAPLTLSISNFTWDDAMVGGTATLAFTGLNATFNGTYEILAQEIAGVHNLTLDGSTSATITNPTAGTLSVTYQPADSIPELPVFIQPWKIYIVTFAGISIRTKFEEDISALELRLKQEDARARRISERRNSNLRQIPLLNQRGVDSPNYDNGGWDW
jgi:hypothetical protein